MRFKRQPDAGFTLLEAVVAFSLLALVLTLALPALTGAATRQAGRLAALHAAEFATSIYEEYRATYPIMQPRGQDASGWVWHITEARVAPDGPTAIDSAMHLVELRLSVSHEDLPTQTFNFTTLVARPYP